MYPNQTAAHFLRGSLDRQRTPPQCLQRVGDAPELQCTQPEDVALPPTCAPTSGKRIVSRGPNGVELSQTRTYQLILML